MDSNVWVVINDGSYQVFTDLEEAKRCDGTIVIAPLNPPVECTYRVTATMGSSVGWEASVYGKAGISRTTGWSKYGGRHGHASYQWDVQATSSREAIEKAKQLFRDSI